MEIIPSVDNIAIALHLDTVDGIHLPLRAAQDYLVLEIEKYIHITESCVVAYASSVSNLVMKIKLMTIKSRVIANQIYNDGVERFVRIAARILITNYEQAQQDEDREYKAESENCYELVSELDALLKSLQNYIRHHLDSSNSLKNIKQKYQTMIDEFRNNVKTLSQMLLSSANLIEDCRIHIAAIQIKVVELKRLNQKYDDVINHIKHFAQKYNKNF